MTRLTNLTTRIATWVESRLGTKVLMDRKERAARLVEEAIELCQAEGVPEIRAINICRRVYERPVGVPRQESAGVGVCWLAYCYATGTLPLDVVEEEVARIEGVNPEVTRAKHNAKVHADLAMPLTR